MDESDRWYHKWLENGCPDDPIGYHDEAWYAQHMTRIVLQAVNNLGLSDLSLHGTRVAVTRGKCS